MKKIIIVVLLFVAVNATAQNDAAEDTVTGPVISAVGKPDGTKKEIKIDKDSARLKSADGMVELIIPEGAVPKNTIISIQPIVNLMANGNGKAYRLEPSGIVFKKPMKLIFHYDGEEITDSMQLLMGIAMQDDKGQWFSLNKFNLDTLAKTISGNINHFSAWSNFSRLRIDPGYARVKVNKTKNLEITFLTPSSGDDDELMPLTPVRRQNIPWRAIWDANEILNGNRTVGTISATSRRFATYKAPAQVPDKNPVAVTATLLGIVYRTRVNGRWITFENLKLVSNILVYDNAYEVTMISRQQRSNYSYTDTGSFVVSVDGRNAKIIERVNKNSTDNLEFSCDCTYTLINPAANHGHIHITGVKNIKLTPAQPPAYPLVEIEFIAAPMRYSTLQITLKDKNGKTFTSTSDAASALVAKSNAMPLFIKFLAKEGEQVIEDRPEPGGYYKVKVRKLNEE